MEKNETILAMGMPGPQELIIVLVIVILLFGAKKIPQLARGVGQGLGEFKKGRSEGEAKDDPPPEENEESKVD